jgi:hypothetical protein
MLALQDNWSRHTLGRSPVQASAPNGSPNRIQEVGGTGERTKYLTPAHVLAPVMFKDDLRVGFLPGDLLSSTE